jgi:hypothetical protein
LEELKKIFRYKGILIILASTKSRDLKLLLREEAGVVLDFGLIEAVMNIYSKMATFLSDNISDRAKT